MSIKKFFLKFLAIMLSLLFMWLTRFGIDYWRVAKNFQKPLFSYNTEIQDDVGCGFYYGLGYTYYIEGNFMPLDEFPGVTQYQLFLFGHEISSGFRD